MSNFRFYLSFENSRVEGYVTEKLWNALLYGTIPIYWGNPSVNEVLPDVDAIIRVSDFSSLADLAVGKALSPICP